MAKPYWQTVITMTAAAILVPVIGGAAEQSGTAAATDAAETSTSSLEEIVVTAQRRQETLQRAAIAVSAVSGDQLAAAGVTSPSDFSQLVPSLQITESNGPYPLFYLRGVGAIAGNAFQDTAIALNFDGVYIGRPSGANGLFFDLERVEVLKGPQGTLYGRNATGGAINILPKKPILGEGGGSASAEIGNHGAYRADGALNVPLGDRAALRAAAFHVQHDPYMNDGTDDQDMSGGRLSVSLEASESVNIGFVADYSKQQDTGAGSTVIGNNVFNAFSQRPTQYPGPAFDNDDRVGLSSAQGAAFLGGQPNTILGAPLLPFPASQYNDSYASGISSTLDWSTPVGTLTLLPAYRKSRVDYVTTNPGFQIAERGEDRQTSFEARFASTDDYALRYLLGAYYFDEEYNAPHYRVNQQSQISFQEMHTTTRSTAVFSRLTYAVTDAVRLNAGVRYTEEEKGFRGSLNSNTRICVFQGPTGPSCPNATRYPYSLTTTLPPSFVPGPEGTIDTSTSLTDSGNDSYERTTWRVGADWDLTDQNLLYISYETGFKAGGFFFSSDEGTFKPETLKAYTLGSKNRFFGSRLQLNVELFYWDYADQQLSHLGADSQGLTIFPTENVGAATFKGVEIETQFLPVDNTLLGLNVQYNDASYDSFVYSTPNFAGSASNGTGCPSAQVTTTTYVVDCSGFRPPFAPRWTVNADVQQTFPLGAAGELVASAHAHYQTESYTGTEFLPVQVQSSYTIADFALTYSAPEDRYYVSGFVDNAFDKTVVSTSNLATFSYWASGTLRAPRTYGVRAGMNF